MQILYQTQQYNEADQRFRWLESQRTPLPRDLIQIWAGVALQRQDYDRATALLKKFTSIELKDSQEMVWAGQIMSVLGREAKAKGRDKDAAKLLNDAEKWLRRAVDLDPKLATTWLPLVRFYAFNNAIDKAKKTIEEAGKKLPPQDVALTFAQCYDALGMDDLAEKEFQEALAASPQNVAIVRSAADFFVRKNRPTLAEPLLQKIISGSLKTELTDVVWARRQLALCYAKRRGFQNIRKAEELIEKNRASAATSTADIQILARLYASDPNLAKRGEAMDMFEDMIKRQLATTEDRFLLAILYMKSNEWPKASGILRGLVATAETEPSYLVTYIEALLQHGEVSDVEDYIEHLKKLTSNGFIAFSLQADMLFVAKRPQEAFDLLTGFVDRTDVQPKSRAERTYLVADKLASLYQQLMKSDGKLFADQFSRQAEIFYRASSEDHPGFQLQLAEFLSRLSPAKIDESLDMLDRIMDGSDPFAFGMTCAAVQKNIATHKDKVKRLDEVVERALRKLNRPVTLLMVMADSLTSQSRYADAEKFYREVIKKNPHESTALNNLAVLLALQGVKLDEAMIFANQAIDLLGPIGPVLDSRACVYLAKRDPEKALKDINDSLADTETPIRFFHQAQAFAMMGQESSAKTSIFMANRMGLTPDMLQPVEVPDFEKLKKLLKEP